MTWITPDYLEYIRDTLKNTPVSDEIEHPEREQVFQVRLAKLSEDLDNDSVLWEKIRNYKSSKDVWEDIRTSYLSYCDEKGIPDQHRIVPEDTDSIKGYDPDGEYFGLKMITEVVRQNRFLNKQSRAEVNAISKIAFHMINYQSDWLLQAYQTMSFFEETSQEWTSARPRFSELIKDILFNKADGIFGGELYDGCKVSYNAQTIRLVVLWIIAFSFDLALRPMDTAG